MNLNKNFLTEVIKYLINRGVTLTDVLDTFNEHFNTLDTNDIKREHEKQYEIRKPITDLDLLLCGRSVEESSTPCQKVEEKTKKPAPLKVSLSPNLRDYPTSITPRGKGVSKARKMLFEVVEGKTVLEHLKANNINYKLFDTRIRKNWTMEKACMTPMTRVISPYTKSKKPKESKAVIVPDNVKVVEESSTPEKATESVTNATELNGNNVTAVILDTPNPDAIRKDNDDNIEKALKKFITSTTGIKYDESKKDKKPKEPKSDLTVLEVCQKMNVTTHELKEMIATGDFPQPDHDKKWSVKLLKKEGII